MVLKRLHLVNFAIIRLQRWIKTLIKSYLKNIISFRNHIITRFLILNISILILRSKRMLIKPNYRINHNINMKKVKWLQKGK